MDGQIMLLIPPVGSEESMLAFRKTQDSLWREIARFLERESCEKIRLSLK
jgi:hypothetical protein